MRTRRIQIGPHKQREARGIAVLGHLAQNVHDDRDIQTQAVAVVAVIAVLCGVLRARRRSEQDFHIRTAPHHAVVLDPVDGEIPRRGSGGLDVRQAHGAANHVPALEEHGPWAEGAKRARRAQHIFDRGQLRRRGRVEVCAVAVLAVLQEQRGLARVGSEQRCEREELRYERAEGFAFEERVAGR